MKKIYFFLIISIIVFSVSAQVTLVTEDFETDGEGSRYTSTTFDDCGITSDYFLRTSTNPYLCPTGNFFETLLGLQGSNFWVSEDVGGATGNSGNNFVTLDLNSVNITGYSSLNVSLYMAVGREDTRWENTDYIKIQANVDGGGFSTIGQFVGDNPTAFIGGLLRQDTDLNGVADLLAPVITKTFTKYTFSVPVTGISLIARVRIEQDGGSEEFAFDKIEVTGVLSANAAPVLANIEGAAINYTEEDPATQVSNTITVTDADDINLTGATVQITTNFDASEDVLAASPPAGISASFVGNTLTLSGTSSVANYQTALRSVTYDNTDNDNPSAATRTIRFQVNDGTDGSNFQTRNINVLATIPGTSLVDSLNNQICESFETDGNGERYASNSFNSGGDFFFRTTPNPGDFATTIKGTDGTFAWFGEDVVSAANGDVPGFMELAPMYINGLHEFTVELLMAHSSSGVWETDDKVKIQYRTNGGTWTDIGIFTGDGTTAPKESVSLVALKDTLKPFSYTFNVTADSLYVRVYADVDGGSEEFAFDNICVTGNVGQQAPVLAAIESGNIDYTEGDAAVQITNSIIVTDVDDTNLDSAMISVCLGYIMGEDILSFTNVGSITHSFDAVSGVLKIRGDTTLSAYQTFLRSVTYHNTETSNPANGLREICFQVNDGQANSNIQSRFINVIDLLEDPGCLPITESFETDGEGTRYETNTFADTISGSDFFVLTDTKPSFHADAPIGIDGAFYWASEDVKSGSNGNVPAYILMAPMDITGASGLSVSVMLAVSNNTSSNRWEPNDAVFIQSKVDAGSWITVGAFYGDNITGGDLRNDADLNGSGEGTALTTTLTNFTFPISSSGTNLQVRVLIDQLGGTEELMLDKIVIAGAVPVNLVCTDTTIYLDGSGNAILSAEQVYAGSAEKCGIDSMYVLPGIFTCADTGINIVTLTATDINDTVYTCTANVTVVDTTSPTAVCQNITAYLDGAGNASIVAADIDGGSTDNCSSVTLSASGTAFTCADIGVNNITLTVTDGSSNTASCSAVVTVADTTSPAAICQNITIYLNGSGYAGLNAADIDGGSTDNCSVALLSASDTAFYCADLGVNNVTLTVFDSNSNSANCNAVVTVIDSTSPTAVCQNITAFLDGAGNASIVAADIDGGSTDNCSSVSLSASQTAFTCADVGSNIITLTVTDGSLNTANCVAEVTIADTISPVAICQNITVYLDGAGSAAIIPSDIDGGSTDNCALGTLSASQTLLSCPDSSGVEWVTLTVPDVSGNSSTCIARVELIDTLAPVPPAPPIDLNLNCAADVPPPVSLTAVDNCDGNILVNPTASVTPGVCLNDFVMTRTWTFTDISGNSSSISQTITVLDTLAPAILSVPADLNLACADEVPPPVTLTAIDNCSDTLRVNPSTVVTPGSCLNDFVLVRTWTFADTCGNTSSVSQTITVLDTLAPVPLSIPSDLNLACADEVPPPVTLIAIDNCSDTLRVNPSTVVTPGSCLNDFVLVRTWTFADTCGNTSSVSQTITVLDTLAPAILSVPADLNLACADEVPPPVTLTAIDNCSDTLRVNPTTVVTPGSCLNDFVLVRTWTFADTCGNTSSVSQIITVLDTLAPAILSVPADLNVTCADDVPPPVTLTAIDNCSDTLRVNPTTVVTPGSCINDFVLVRTWTFVDTCGNASSVSQIITVLDTIPPQVPIPPANVNVACADEVPPPVTLTAIDNCSDTITVNPTTVVTPGSCINDFVLVRTWTFIDTCGNASSVSQTITVLDTIAPVPPAAPADLILQCAADVPPPVDLTAVDNCSDSITVSPTAQVTPGSCINDFVLVRTWTFVDTCGNASSVSQTIIVKDTIAPTIVGNAIDIVLYENGEYVLTPRDIFTLSEGTTDNCSSYDELEISVFPKSFECIHVGAPVSVKITAVDVCGNESGLWTTVTVYDETSPVAICQDITLELDENGKVDIFPGQINAGNDRASIPGWARTYNGLEKGSYDACGIELIELDKYTFYCSDLGENTVSLTVTDPSGNTAGCESTVIVVDNIAPTVEAIADITIEVEPGKCETEIIYPLLETWDNCGIIATQTAGLGADGMFPLGTTTETWMVEDVAGNSVEVSFEVIVTTSNALPTIDAINDIQTQEDVSGIIIPISGITAGNDCIKQDVTVEVTATNPELLTSVQLHYESGDETGEIQLAIASDMSGESEITVTVIDSESDTITESFKVVVTAVNDAPFVVNAVPDQILNASYELELTISSVLGEIFDDIDDDTLSIEIHTDGGELPAWVTLLGDVLTLKPMIADTGCVTIVLTATDAAGATATDSFEVCIDGYPVSIGEVEAGLFEVKMYPNPTFGPVNLDIISSETKDTEVSVMSITGQEVFRKKYKASEQIRFNLSENVSGMYMVILNVDGRQITRKLILGKK